MPTGGRRRRLLLPPPVPLRPRRPLRQRMLQCQPRHRRCVLEPCGEWLVVQCRSTLLLLAATAHAPPSHPPPPPLPWEPVHPTKANRSGTHRGPLPNAEVVAETPDGKKWYKCPQGLEIAREKSSAQWCWTNKFKEKVCPESPLPKKVVTSRPPRRST